MSDLETQSNTIGAPAMPGWRLWSCLAMGGGAVGAVISAMLDIRQFGYSWLLAFLLFLSLVLGALCMVMLHHLFDAAWSTPIRRLMEHVACLSFPVMTVLFVPIALLARKLYPVVQGGGTQFSLTTFWLASGLCFLVWGFVSRQLRRCSIRQDEVGETGFTFKMRRYSAVGMLLLAVTLTIATVIWMEALTPEWRSTVYGVWYFAASMWVAYPTVYVMAALLARSGPLRAVFREEQRYFLGTLSLAFTVFYAYITYSQFFIIWNGNLPGETFWYATRQRGGWVPIGWLLLIGHFIVPFLLLLRIDWKLKLRMMLPLCAWIWLMHFCDLQFQIMPALHPLGPQRVWSDAACVLLYGGILSFTFGRYFSAHAPYPVRDPRLAEALGVHLPPTTDIATAPQRAK